MIWGMQRGTILIRGYASIKRLRTPTLSYDASYNLFPECYFKAYIISTPKREVCNHTGPPDNTNHVREWTFTEMQLYLESEGFVIIKSFNGIASVYCGQHVGYFN